MSKCQIEVVCKKDVACIFTKELEFFKDRTGYDFILKELGNAIVISISTNKNSQYLMSCLNETRIRTIKKYGEACAYRVMYKLNGKEHCYNHYNKDEFTMILPNKFLIKDRKADTAIIDEDVEMHIYLSGKPITVIYYGAIFLLILCVNIFLALAIFRMTNDVRLSSGVYLFSSLILCGNIGSKYLYKFYSSVIANVDEITDDF